MTLRTTSRTITFARPFSLDGLEETQPAGSYRVQTDEEPIEGLSFLAFRRVATVIFLPLSHRWNRVLPSDPCHAGSSRRRTGAGCFGIPRCMIGRPASWADLGKTDAG